jgi:hypothetical protein
MFGITSGETRQRIAGCNVLNDRASVCARQTFSGSKNVPIAEIVALQLDGVALRIFVVNRHG